VGLEDSAAGAGLAEVAVSVDSAVGVPVAAVLVAVGSE